MSLVVFAGASQFMAVVMIQSGVGMPLIVASTFLVNLRRLVMGLSLSPYLSDLARPGFDGGSVSWRIVSSKEGRPS